LKKAVITAAGLGTRLLSETKELPKEMLPIFQRVNGELALKPLLQVIFEQLYDVGIRDFCFVIGRGKRSIEDHFTPDWDFLEYLLKAGKELAAKSIEIFYKKVEDSNISWVNQPQPRGFGDAVLRAEKFVANDNLWLLQATHT
jgi:UDP-glucose pyrophosphorylase (EC 2.7.7.9)